MGTAVARFPKAASRAAERPYVDALLHLSALSIVAGSIHAVVAAPHFAEYRLFGFLFVALAAIQIGWGASVYARPSVLVFGSGLAISVGVIAVWIVSRTIGLPFGPEAEQVGVLDLAATAGEVSIAVLCLAFLAVGPAIRGRGSLPARFRPLHPIALGIMTAGLLALLLGGGHHAH